MSTREQENRQKEILTISVHRIIPFFFLFFYLAIHTVGVSTKWLR